MRNRFAIIFLGCILLSMSCQQAEKIELDSSKVSGALASLAFSEFQAAQAIVPSLTTDDSWSCSSLVNCQNVYDVEFTATDTLTISVTSVTNASVLRLALYAPNVPLNGTNFLNGSTNDRTCPNPPTYLNQDQPDTVTTSITSTGVYQVVVGRDWNSSANSGGNYTLTLTTTASVMTNFTKTASNIPTQSTGMQCP
ncbi:hypothetical protein CH373_07850 [Leptospira perolatii]|uniref:Peptidase C-terminal archaeal/bacterial domain-containing protein n=1 Tax=Leptospira perolatii TaxID=2023191 RepID=A0A2M9ZNW2_9LEPT|nr:hypothetical protein CH360_13865 [Leptospira perolatii]PJZ73669.1 hypothetical protein CH373_07850 [Leptospira perolatii]